MSFYRKYALERLVQDAAPPTFLARENAGGRQVYLHLLCTLDARSRNVLISRVRALAHGGNSDIVEFAEDPIAPCVVTTVLDNFTGFREWIDRISAVRDADVQPALRARAATATPDETKNAPASFTALFAAADRYLHVREASPAAPPAGPSFTGSPPRVPAMPCLAEEAKPEAAPPPARALSAKAAASGPGEFTRFFGSPLASSSLPVEEVERGRKPEIPIAAKRPFEGPGEFTRWFGPAEPREGPVDSNPGRFPTFAGDATGIVEAAQSPPGQPPLPVAPLPGPSEYTRIMTAHREGRGTAEQPAAYVPGPRPGVSPAIVIGVSVGAVLLVLLLVVAVLTNC